jgi:MFS family permease
MGMVNALCSGGFFALVSFFPVNLMIGFSAGQGFSGVMMNIIQYIVLGSVNSGNRKKDLNKTAWIYFGISAGMLLIVLIILLIQLRTDFFKYYLRPLNNAKKGENKNEEDKKKENKNVEENLKASTEREIQLNLKENENKNENKEKEINKNTVVAINESSPPPPKKKREISCLEMFKILMDLDILRTYINFISNALFPKAGVTQALFKEDKYKTVTILLMYNFTDFFGRYIVLAFKQTKTKTYVIAIGRTILVFLLIFNYYCQIDLKTDLNVTSSLLIIYVIALGLTHGMGNSLCFGIAPTLVEDDLKMQAGSSMSFFTVFGLFLGSCLGFLTKYILEQIEK